MMRKHIPLSAVAAAALAGSASAGSTISLADLIDNGDTVIVGDKMFSNFSYAATGDMPDAGDIDVFGFTDSGDFGIAFNGNFIDLAGGGASDALITFDVTVLDPNLQIAVVNLEADIAVNGGAGGDSFGSVTESFLPSVTTGTMVVFADEASAQLTDSIAINPNATTLSVQKDVILFADDDATSVTISQIDQTFEQVPEPGSLALAALGSALLLRRRR